MAGPDAPGTRGRALWIVNHYADAPDRPSGTRHFDLARRLEARGWTVTIFASGFSHVTGREERLATGRLFRTQVFDGVRFVWVRTIPYRGNTWRRQVNMLSFLISFLVVQTRYPRPDAVIGSTVHPFAALAAWCAASLRGATFLYEIRDLWPQTLVDLGAMTQGSRPERTLRWIEAFLARRAAAVLALQPGVEDYLRGRGLPADHVVYLPNGVDLAEFDSATRLTGREAGSTGADSTVHIIREMRDQGRFVIGYLGAFGRVNRVEVLIEAAEIAERREPGRIGLLLVGDGPERPGLEDAARRVSGVSLAGPVPKSAVPLVLAELDAAAVHATFTPIYRYGVSFNKVFEYMAARLPILFGCATAYDPVALSASGRSIPPDDPEEMAAAFLEMAGSAAEVLAAMGRSGREYVEREHDIRHLADRLATTLEGLGVGPAENRG